VAVVRWMPDSMNTENRKLPRKDIRNSQRCSVPVSGASPGARRVHGAIATAPIAKRRNASANTGNAATSGFDRAT
jgi:hypothetical protein